MMYVKIWSRISPSKINKIRFSDTVNILLNEFENLFH